MPAKSKVAKDKAPKRAALPPAPAIGELMECETVLDAIDLAVDTDQTHGQVTSAFPALLLSVVLAFACLDVH